MKIIINTLKNDKRFTIDDTKKALYISDGIIVRSIDLTNERQAVILVDSYTKLTEPQTNNFIEIS